MPTTITAVHKAQVDQQAADTLADPRWFPMRYDGRNDAFIFAWVTPDVHRALTFISDFRPAETRTIARAALDGGRIATAPLHVILHSGLGGSTLLARALGQPGVVTTLKEPPILTDVVALGLRSSENEAADALSRVSALLSRPFTSGEALVCKMSSVGNGLSAAIARQRRDTQILCLQTPLVQFLASLASKGTEGRIGGRRLFVGLQNARMACTALSSSELIDHTDLQLAALAWLSIQNMISDTAKHLGPKRVRSMGSEELLADPRNSLAAIADHFRLKLDVDERLASGVFRRHAKTGQPFSNEKRAAELSKTLSDHGAEILGIVDWARKVSDANGIAWDLPYPLLD